MSALMVEPFLVPIKAAAIPFDNNTNQTKTVFGYFPFVFYFTLSEACSLSNES